MKLINRLRENWLWDKTSKYYQRAIQYNKGVAQDAYHFNLISPEVNALNNVLSWVIMKLKLIFPKLIFRLFLILILFFA